MSRVVFDREEIRFVVDGKSMPVEVWLRETSLVYCLEPIVERVDTDEIRTQADCGTVFHVSIVDFCVLLLCPFLPQ